MKSNIFKLTQNIEEGSCVSVNKSVLTKIKENPDLFTPDLKFD